MDDGQKVILVNQVRNVRGSSYCCSFLLIPLFTAIIIGAISFGAFFSVRFLGPDRYESNALKLEFVPLELLISFLLSVILVTLFFSPSRIDRFVNWWLGYHQR